MQMTEDRALQRFQAERVTLRRFFTQNVKLVETALRAEKVDFSKVNVEYAKLADKAERLFLLDSKIREALFNEDILLEEDSDPEKAPSRLVQEFEEAEVYREAWCTIVSQRQDLLEKQEAQLISIEPPDSDRKAMAENTLGQVSAPEDEATKLKRKRKREKMPTTPAGPVNPDRGYLCAFCSGEHASKNCPKAHKIAPDSRIKVLKDKNVCNKCLQKYHVGRCKTTPHCLVCSKSHATSMCSMPLKADSDSDISDDEPAESCNMNLRNRTRVPVKSAPKKHKQSPHCLVCSKSHATSMCSMTLKADSDSDISDDEPAESDKMNLRNRTRVPMKSAPKKHKQYECSMCDYKTTCQSFLDRHNLTHTGKKPFACRKCDYRANRKHHLERHMMSHTKKKPYACEICDYTAIQKIQLTHHMMSHEGKKPFACDECDYTAIRKINLTQHKKVHSDEKPYACEDCDYRAKLPYHLRQHIAAFH